MSAYPTIFASSISFDHGLSEISEYQALGIGTVRFKHTEFINRQRFTFRYENIPQSVVSQIRNHYDVSGGIVGEFTVPIAVLAGAGITNSSSVFRYAEIPQEEQFGVFFNINVTLETVSGIEMRFSLDSGTASLPAETAFNELVFQGTAPFTLNGSTSALATLILKGE